MPCANAVLDVLDRPMIHHSQFHTIREVKDPLSKGLRDGAGRKGPSPIVPCRHSRPRLRAVGGEDHTHPAVVASVRGCTYETLTVCDWAFRLFPPDTALDERD